MQRDALANQQTRTDGLARERVTERKPIGRLLDDELRVHELLDERQQLGLAVLRQRLEQPEVEPASRHRGDRRDATCLGAQSGQPSPNRLGGRARHMRVLQRAGAPRAVGLREIAGDDERLEHLFDEERIAFGEAVQRVHEW